MPPRIIPKLSITYDRLRFYVCNLCAPTPQPEQTTEQLAGGSGECVQVGPCGHPVHNRQEEGDRVVCLYCGWSWPTDPEQWSSVSERVQAAKAKGRRPRYSGAMNPRSVGGNHEPFRATDFIQRATVAEPHQLRYLAPAQFDPAEPRPWRKLTVLPNFSPLYTLFALAALEDSAARCQGIHERREFRGHTHVQLIDPPALPHPLDLCAKVCWQSGDAFDVGHDVSTPGERRLGFIVTCRGLRLEPGTCLFVYGGEAVGVGGFVGGEPVGVFTPEALPICDGGKFARDRHGLEHALAGVIVRKFLERGGGS